MCKKKSEKIETLLKEGSKVIKAKKAKTKVKT